MDILARNLISGTLTLVLVAGCNRPKAQGDDSASPGSGATAAPGSTAIVGDGPSTSAGARFVGLYRSTWGPTRFAEVGDQVTAKYPNGNMTCKPSGDSLDCDWRESSTFGKAKLAKLPDGNIKGTWGNGGSATNGGPWLFILESTNGSTMPASLGPTANFAGTYKSTWGPTVFKQDGNTVTAKYPNGSMTCQATASTLDCDWREGSTFGKAKLVKEATGSIRGTWGNGGSATNGGPWIFNP